MRLTAAQVRALQALRFGPQMVGRRHGLSGRTIQWLGKRGLITEKFHNGEILMWTVASITGKGLAALRDHETKEGRGR
jgi:hypothetical protein